VPQAPFPGGRTAEGGAWQVFQGRDRRGLPRPRDLRMASTTSATCPSFTRSTQSGGSLTTDSNRRRHPWVRRSQRLLYRQPSVRFTRPRRCALPSTYRRATRSSHSSRTAWLQKRPCKTCPITHRPSPPAVVGRSATRSPVNARRNRIRIPLLTHKVQVTRHHGVPVQLERDLLGRLPTNAEDSLVVSSQEEEPTAVVSSVSDLNRDASRQDSPRTRRMGTLFRTNPRQGECRNPVSARKRCLAPFRCEKVPGTMLTAGCVTTGTGGIAARRGPRAALEAAPTWMGARTRYRATAGRKAQPAV
jgi:hypothetical protein